MYHDSIKPAGLVSLESPSLFEQSLAGGLRGHRAAKGLAASCIMYSFIQSLGEILPACIKLLQHGNKVLSISLYL